MSNEEMKSKLDGFKKTYSDFMMGNIDDEELAKDTTQPFWQSMYLSKKRLNNKGLDVDVRFSEEKGNRINTISVVNDGKNIIGTYKDNIIEEKSFKKDGRTIYDHKGKKMWIGNVIKARDENNMVACPNCGNMGDISSYINGCDYCNSRFQVEDFEEKVSSFVVSDDEKRKVQNISTRCSLGAIIAGIVMIIAMIVSFIVVIILPSILLTIVVTSIASTLLSRFTSKNKSLSADAKAFFKQIRSIILDISSLFKSSLEYHFAVKVVSEVTISAFVSPLYQPPKLKPTRRSRSATAVPFLTNSA